MKTFRVERQMDKQTDGQMGSEKVFILVHAFLLEPDTWIKPFFYQKNE